MKKYRSILGKGILIAVLVMSQTVCVFGANKNDSVSSSGIEQIIGADNDKTKLSRETYEKMEEMGKVTKEITRVDEEFSQISYTCVPDKREVDTLTENTNKEMEIVSVNYIVPANEITPRIIGEYSEEDPQGIITFKNRLTFTYYYLDETLRLRAAKPTAGTVRITNFTGSGLKNLKISLKGWGVPIDGSAEETHTRPTISSVSVGKDYTYSPIFDTYYAIDANAHLYLRASVEYSGGTLSTQLMYGTNP